MGGRASVLVCTFPSRVRVVALYYARLSGQEAMKLIRHHTMPAIKCVNSSGSIGGVGGIGGACICASTVYMRMY